MPNITDNKKNTLLIAITAYTSGDAQSTRVDDIAESVRNLFNVVVLTSFADQNRMEQSFPKVVVHKNYYLSFMSKRIKKLFRRSELVIVETGLPYAFCSYLFRTKFIWILYGPDRGIHFSGLYRFLNKLNILLERKFLLKSAELLVTPAEWVSNFYRKKGANVVSIPAAIDQSIFYPKQIKQFDKKDIKLIIVGRWDGFDGRKRQHDFLKILPGIVKSYPDIHLTLAGLDQPSIEILGNLASSLQISGNIDFVGGLEPNEVAKVMNESDICVSNTISDAFYRIIVEAFACGLPAIARDASDIIPDFHLAPKHHVLYSRAGALYDGTAQSFLRALNEVVVNYELFRENAIRYASKFTRESIMKQYRDIILSNSENNPGLEAIKFSKAAGKQDEEK